LPDNVFYYDIPDIANVAILTDRTLSMVKASAYEKVAREALSKVGSCSNTGKNVLDMIRDLRKNTEDSGIDTIRT
jgi:hypothetical protein